MSSLLANIIYYFVEPIITPIILNYVFPDMILIIRLFTQDSINTSLRYLSSRLLIPIEEKETTMLSPTTKYITYIGFSSIYYMLDVLTWYNYPRQYMYYIITIITSPVIIENFFHNQIWILDKIEHIQKKFINYTACVCLSKSLNYICRNNLDSDPKISAFELQDVMGMQNLQYIWTFLKILLITTIIKYVEGSKYIYGRILQMLYDRGSLIQIPQYHRSMIIDSQINNPKETLTKIIVKRKWHYFYDPQVLNLIIQIYKNQKGSLLREIIQRFRMRTLQFFGLWTLYKIIPLPILAFLYRIKEPYPYNLLIPSLDLLLLLLFPHKIMFISFFSEFSEYLDNAASHHLLQKSKEFAPLVFRVLFHKNKYNMYLALSIPVIYYLNYLHPYSLIILPFISKYNFIYIWMLSLGIFSHYNLYHISILALILFFTINIYNIKHLPAKHTDLLNVISSYWATSNTQLHHKNIKLINQ